MRRLSGGHISYYTAAVGANESMLYFMDVYGNTLEVFDVDTQARKIVLVINEIQDKMVAGIQPIQFDGREALAITTDPGYKQSQIVIVDVATQKVVSAVTGYDFGLRDANSGDEPFNPNAAIDPHGNHGTFCDHDGCLLVNLKTKAIVANFTLGLGNNSETTFSADGKYVFACNAALNKMIVMDTASGNEISSSIAEICERGKMAMGGSSYMFHNHNQIFSIDPNGKIVDMVTADGPLNAFDDAELVGVEQNQGVVITVDWNGRVQKHLLKLK